MKYAVWLNIHGYVEVEARTSGVAKHAFDMLSMDEAKARLVWMEDEVEDINEIDDGFDLDKMTYNGEPLPKSGYVRVQPHCTTVVKKVRFTRSDEQMLLHIQHPDYYELSVDARQFNLLELL